MSLGLAGKGGYRHEWVRGSYKALGLTARREGEEGSELLLGASLG